MALNDNDLLLINDSQDGNEAKHIKLSTLQSNIATSDANTLQAVTDNGNTTTNAIDINSDGPHCTPLGTRPLSQTVLADRLP